jgi:hypothetical protein
MRRIAWRQVAAVDGSLAGRRVLLSALVVAVGVISPAVALGAPNGALTFNGKAVGVATTDTSTNPAPVNVSGVGRITHLGEVVVLANDALTPHGLGPAIPYTITGTETVIVATGDQLFGTVIGMGVNNNGATRGMNVVTVTGGTGRFTGATGSYTEKYSGHIFSQIGTELVGPLHTVFRGHITLGGGYCDPLQGGPGYCDPLQPPAARDHHRHRGRG